MFNTGSPVKGVDFIDRIKHIPVFKAYLDNNQHLMIKAPRRFGKTSLVKHVIENQNDYDYIYVDIRRVTTLKTLSNQILDKAYTFVGIDNFIRKSKESLVGLLKTVQGIKLGEIAEITIEYIEQDVDELELFLHTLDIVDNIAIKQNINIKFVFDEFQDIIKIADKSILEQLRSVAQHHSNITYVFLGSIESIMTRIFEDKKSPFFHFARIMPLGGLDIEELGDYIFSEFDKRDFTYDKIAIKTILSFLQGHPDYSMQVFQSIFFRVLIDNTLKINMELCLSVLKSVIIENKAYLDELIQQTKSKKHLHELLSTIANDESSNLDSKTLYNTHSHLEDMGLIKKTARGEYEIVDIFLCVLLKKSNRELSLNTDELSIDIKT